MITRASQTRVPRRISNNEESADQIKAVTKDKEILSFIDILTQSD